QVFQTWVDAETFLNEYALQKGFSFRRRLAEVPVEYSIKALLSINNDDMVQFVDFCVTHGTTGARNIGCLLKEISRKKNLSENLYNVIQNAKKKLTPNINLDASDLLQHLYNLKTKSEN
ncbi:15056_t:CDS:2, partial [Rhizophagus irregularis]